MKVTRRDYFAGLAMQSLISGGYFYNNQRVGDLARHAFTIANSMTEMSLIDDGQDFHKGLFEDAFQIDRYGYFNIGKYDSSWEDAEREFKRMQELRAEERKRTEQKMDDPSR